MLFDLNNKISFLLAVVGVIIIMAVLAFLRFHLDDRTAFYVGVPGIVVGLAIFVVGVYLNRTHNDRDETKQNVRVIK